MCVPGAEASAASATAPGSPDAAHRPTRRGGAAAGSPSGAVSFALLVYEAGAAAAVVVVTPVPPLLSYCLMRSGSPTSLPVSALPPLSTLNFPLSTPTKYVQLVGEILPKFS